jgi:SAM-dependent methyltransferase
VSFAVGAEAYDAFMGRWSEPLAQELLDLVGVNAFPRVLDVGCGPGAVTAALVERLGHQGVVACDPSPTFVEAVKARVPTVQVHRVPAEKLPFADGAFGLVLAQLVVHFMTDPVAGLREMRRVTTPGGGVAACVWDHAGGRSPLDMFWRAVAQVDPGAHDEADLAGAREGHLLELFGQAGLRDVEGSLLTVHVTFTDLDDWWEPFLLGVGPAGDYVAGLDEAQRTELRAACAALLPPAPFTLSGSAWAAVGRA